MTMTAPSGQPSTNAEEDAAELRLARGGLAFVDRDTERAYRAWNARRSIPFTRAGMLFAGIAWAGAIAGTWLGAHDLIDRDRLVLATVLAATIVLPLLILCTALTYLPRWAAWSQPASGAANSVSGLLGLAICHLLTDLPGVSATVAVMFTYFGFAVFRLRPAHAVAAVAPYVILHQVLLRDDAGTVAFVVFTNLPWIAFLTGLLLCAVLDRVSRDGFRQERIIARQRAAIERERARADDLLHSILPGPIAERLKGGATVIAERLDEVTVLFADLVGFTPRAARQPPERVVELLDRVVRRFDELAARHGVEKIKTIGDAYMAVAGAPAPRADHARAIAELALAMRDAIRELDVDPPLRLRIGVCSGSVVAGVIGARRFAYDLWGDTVNTAARMESHGVADEIQVAEATARRLEADYELAPRGEIDVKGKGPMRTWLLVGRRADAPAAAARSAR